MIIPPYNIYTTRVAEMLDKYFTYGDTALEIGTGSGILSKIMIEKGASRIVATDIEEEAIDTLRQETVPKSNGRLETVQTSLNNGIEGIFDFIVCTTDTPTVRVLFDSVQKNMDRHTKFIFVWASWEEAITIRERFHIVEHTHYQTDYEVYVVKLKGEDNGIL